jgi:tRNA (mo5U34)-methyltransferase
MGTATDEEGLREAVAQREWYHTLELAPGVVTPGWFDTRAALQRLPFPLSLEGKRCLDVGTFDGFWAFEMERRGASEVLAVDLLDPEAWDWPMNSAPRAVEEIGRRKASGSGFEIAHRALGSAVHRRELSVYDLDQGDVGRFDFVYVGSLLLHLRDPIRALERVQLVCRGEVLVVDGIDLWLSALPQPVASLDGMGRPWWWRPNLAGLARMVEAAGFQVVRQPMRVFMPSGGGQPLPPLRPQLLRSRAGRETALTIWKGAPHGVVLARPISRAM